MLLLMKFMDIQVLLSNIAKPEYIHNNNEIYSSKGNQRNKSEITKTDILIKLHHRNTKKTKRKNKPEWITRITRRTSKQGHSESRVKLAKNCDSQPHHDNKAHKKIAVHNLSLIEHTVRTPFIKIMPPCSNAYIYRNTLNGLIHGSW